MIDLFLSTEPVLMHMLTPDVAVAGIHDKDDRRSRRRQGDPPMLDLPFLVIVAEVAASVLVYYTKNGSSSTKPHTTEVSRDPITAG